MSARLAAFSRAMAGIVNGLAPALVSVAVAVARVGRRFLAARAWTPAAAVRVALIGEMKEPIAKDLLIG
ncbi:MAG: hypothetical protein C4287_23065 [Leptolyngbya sp. ERB_1_2]